MARKQLTALVAAYFAAVDGERLEDILALMAEDCVFSVETHGVVLRGKQEITGMFHRLWRNHRAVRHHGFRYVCDPDAGPDTGRISVQFQVENTEHDGSLTHKSNCNFFDVKAGRFSAVAVYMAGPNTLEGGA